MEKKNNFRLHSSQRADFPSNHLDVSWQTEDELDLFLWLVTWAPVYLLADFLHSAILKQRGKTFTDSVNWFASHTEVKIRRI